MSGASARPPRRRIAGERRPTRPEETPREEVAPAEPAAGSPREQAPATPPPPPGSGDPHPPHAAEDLDAGGTRPAPSWPVVAVLGVVTLALVVTAAVLGLGTWNVREVREQDAVAEATRSAPAAAERASAAILSYGYQTLDADEKAAERYMSPGYKKKYADTFDRLVRPNAAKVKAKVQAEVKASGVSHADADRVDVLLYVNQTTTSTANSGEPQVALNRVRLAMVKIDGSWLVDDITSY